MSDEGSALVQRWEWRAFDTRFNVAESRFGSLESTGVQESEETYLLSSESGANVKIRDDLMDIKILQEVDENGLERWNPVMKASFPMSHGDVQAVFDAVRVSAPTMERNRYGFDQFIAELAEPSGLRAVSVTKRRVRYIVEGCTAEVTEVVVDGRPIRTIAIESPDASAVAHAVRSMGLDGYSNTNYTRGLTEAVDGAPIRYAVIDVGTNSVKFRLAERTTDGQWTTLEDRAEVTRLGEGIESTGAIAPPAVDRTALAIEAMAETARDAGVRAIAAVGTAGMRIASNANDVVDEIRARAGITVEVISGEEESRLAFLAVQTGLDLGAGNIVVFDTGGGSSQFTFGRGSDVTERFSVNVGAVGYTETYGLDRAVSSDVTSAALDAISADLSSLDDRAGPHALIAMGGAVTNMTSVMHELAEYDPDAIHGSVLKRTEIERQIELYASMDADHRRSIVGLQSGRAEVILAGACVVRTVMDKLNVESATVSDRGLRHGVMAERFGA